MVKLLLTFMRQGPFRRALTGQIPGVGYGRNRRYASSLPIGIRLAEKLMRPRQSTGAAAGTRLRGRHRQVADANILQSFADCNGQTLRTDRRSRAGRETLPSTLRINRPQKPLFRPRPPSGRPAARPAYARHSPMARLLQ